MPKPTRYIHCPECGRNKRHCSKGLCKKCYHAQRYLEDREAILERNKRWNKANPGKMAAAYKRWYGQHGLEYHREWKDENRAAVNESARRWRANHPEYGPAYAKANQDKRRASWRRYHARKLGATVGSVDEAAIYERDGHGCIYCGATEDLTLDHVVALFNGGPHSEDNLVVACRSCNSGKRDRPLEVWLQTQPQALAWVM